jgi:hypothetical protein
MPSVAYAEFRKLALYAECRHAECHYAECHYAECRGALIYAIKAGPHYSTIFALKY